jgi:hypothetical protein
MEGRVGAIGQRNGKKRCVVTKRGGAGGAETTELMGDDEVMITKLEEEHI